MRDGFPFVCGCFLFVVYCFLFGCSRLMRDGLVAPAQCGIVEISSLGFGNLVSSLRGTRSLASLNVMACQRFLLFMVWLLPPHAGWFSLFGYSRPMRDGFPFVCG
jgi:hypothetical protein